MFRTWLIFIALVYWIPSSKGQSPEYRQISDLDNVPCNEIYDVFFDQQGYQWIGTEIGVFRYDGNSFQSFTPNKRAGQALTGFTPVDDHLFVFNFLGDIFESKGDSLIAIPIPEWVTNHQYTQMIKGFDGQLLLRSISGVFTYNPKNQVWSHLNPKRVNKPDFSVDTASKKRSETIWLTSSKHVVRIDRTGETHFSVEASYLNRKTLYRHHVLSGKTGVWLCDIYDGSVLHLKDSIFTRYRVPELERLLKEQKLTNFKEFNGKLFFMAYNGLIIFDPSTKTCEWIFRDMPISDMEVDPEGNFWLSTLGYGLLYCPSFDIRSFPNDHVGGSSYKYTYLIPDNQGGLYYSQLSRGVGWIPYGQDQMIEISGPPQADVSAIMRSLDNKIYTAFSSSVYELIGTRLKKIEQSFPATKDMLFTENYVYLASSSGLFYGKSIYNKLPKYPVIKRWCRRLSRSEKADQVWVGTTDGLYLIEKDSIISLLFKGQGVQDILWVPEENSLYCALLSGNIYKIKNGQATLFSKLSSAGQQVYRMRWYDGHIWLATSKGLGKIHCISHQELWFNIRDGLSANVIYDLLFQSGNLWLATGNGLQKIPADIKKNEISPLIYLRHIHINKVKTDRLLIDVVSTDVVSVAFDIISYYSVGEHRLAYSYGDGQWETLPKAQRTINLRNLPLNKSELLVRATDAKGLHSKIIRIPLSIHPPYWQSTWFYIALVVMTFGIMLMAFTIYIRQERKKQENALEKAKLKTNLIESQLTALKAQMNPHFIFNSLNSIYELIIFSETKEAATYLNKFATLLRKVLENSEKESITLNEECEWLGLYLELEKLRFGDDFSYQISTERVHEPYTIPVPTMLLQPFVENAVKHGLLHKTGIKRLEIEFSEEENGIVCLITDNGVGRKKASSYRKVGSDHISFATGAIMKRISMLNDSGKFAIQLTIEDLEFPNGKPAGTQVRLAIQGW